MDLPVPDQLAALRTVVFGATDSWNAAHPHPLRSRKEHAAINVTHVYADAAGKPSYAINVVCTLSGAPPLAFHGHNLMAVAEHARLALEHRIAAEVRRRLAKLQEDGFDGKYGVAS
jgi:hypothetical protein